MTTIQFKLPTQSDLDEWQDQVIQSQGDTKIEYLLAYPELLAAAEGLFESSSFKALGYMAYGWMPTICKSFEDQVFQQKPWITACKAKNPTEAIQAISQITKAPYNNSWVGTSKVLHFLRPNVFPIWDSKVRNFIDVHGLHNAKTLHTNSQDSYLAYISHMHEIIEQRSVDRLKGFLDKKYNYEYSPIRVCELIYFSMS